MSNSYINIFNFAFVNRIVTIIITSTKQQPGMFTFINCSGKAKDISLFHLPPLLENNFLKSLEVVKGFF